MDARPRRYPLDFDALNKGDVIPTQELEQITGHTPFGSPEEGNRWRLALVGLCHEIKRHAGIYARIKRDTIWLLTDEEVCEHTMDLSATYVAKLSRNAADRALIDRTEFSDERKRQAEARDRVVTGVALLARKELQRQRRMQGLTRNEPAELVPPK